MAGRVHMPALRVDRRAVGDVAAAVALPWLPGADVADGRDDLSGHPQAVTNVVHGDVVSVAAEVGRRSYRARALANAGWRDNCGAAAERHPWPFWAGAAPLRADAVSPRPGDGGRYMQVKAMAEL